MRSALMAGVDELRKAVIQHTPSVLTGLGILGFGWLIARTLRGVVRRSLGAAGLDSRIQGTRVHSLLAAFGKDWPASRVLAQLVYLTLLLLTLNTAAGYWGLTGLQAALAKAVAYVPRVLSALALFAGGSYVASVARRAVGAVLRELRNPAASLLESATEAAILLVVGLVAFDMLGANLSFITSNLTLILGAILVVAVFLGCWAMRAPAEELVANYYLRRMLSVGDHIETKTYRGTVLEFVPLGLILREGTGDELFVPARELLGGLKRRQALKPDSPTS